MAVPLRGKIVLDTNVFIDYLRVGLHEDWVARQIDGTVRFLSSVVLMELRLGADTVRRRRLVDRIRASFPPGRLLAPSADLYDRAGALFSRLHGKGSADRLGPMNDLLIALSAWQIGATVITSNEGDFRKIARHVPGLRWASP